MCQYLGDRAPNAKKKGTLFYSTLKVGEKKVALVFLFDALLHRYWHIVNSLVIGYEGSMGGWRGGGEPVEGVVKMT